MWPNTRKKELIFGDHEQMTQLRCRDLYCSVYEMIHTERVKGDVGTLPTGSRACDIAGSWNYSQSWCHDGLACHDIIIAG